MNIRLKNRLNWICLLYARQITEHPSYALSLANKKKFATITIYCPHQKQTRTEWPYTGNNECCGPKPKYLRIASLQIPLLQLGRIDHPFRASPNLAHSNTEWCFVRTEHISLCKHTIGKQIESAFAVGTCATCASSSYSPAPALHDFLFRLYPVFITNTFVQTKCNAHSLT